VGSLITKGINKLSDLRRFARADMRPVYSHYRSGLQFRRNSVDWNEEQKNDWLLQVLRNRIRYAAKTTPYYGDLFSSVGFDLNDDFGFDDFSKLPILDREKISEAGDALISSGVKREQRIRDSTGGSTGAPTHIWKGPLEIGWLESGIEFAFERLGVRRSARIAFFWGHHLDPVMSDSFGARLRSYLLNQRYFDCFRLSPEVFADYHHKFEEYAPDCIVAYATALGHFAEYLAAAGIKPRNYPKTCFVTGAEKLLPKHRDAVEQVFGPNRPVYERYGGRDFGAIATQFEPKRSLAFDVDWTWALVEPETNDPLSPVLVTKLHADAMPLIRYRVGDIARWPSGSSSGNPAHRIEEVIGREVDRVWLKDGSWVHGNEVPHLLKDFPVREFSLVQEKDYQVQLSLVPRDGFGNEHVAKIKKALSLNLVDLKVDVIIVDNVQRTRSNKWRPVSTKVER
jgi:phenylacetate-CoA ligase